MPIIINIPFDTILPCNIHRDSSDKININLSQTLLHSQNQISGQAIKRNSFHHNGLKVLKCFNCNDAYIKTGSHASQLKSNQARFVIQMQYLGWILIRRRCSHLHQNSQRLSTSTQSH